jgi:hypothetical protein
LRACAQNGRIRRHGRENDAGRHAKALNRPAVY